MGKQEWVLKAEKGNVELYKDIANVLGNVDLDYDTLEEEKRKRFERDFKKGYIETPIAVKFSDNDYDLVAGNTRLSGLISKGITNIPIWVVDISDY